MSKKRNRRDVSNTLSNLIATPRVPRYTFSVPTYHKIQIPDLLGPLKQIEDRRTYYPGKFRPAGLISVGKRPRLIAKQNPAYKAPSQTKAIVAFAEPKKVAVCIRRKTRKEVLFATGKGGSRKKQKPPRKSEFSDISCK